MDLPSDSAVTLETLPSRWARAVLGESDALRELAASYWYCVYVWWRRTGLEAEAAATATVTSFTRWAGTAPPTTSDSGSARMRTWLSARLEELAAAAWEEAGEPAIAIEREWAEERYMDESAGEVDAIFNRRWALTVLEFAMQSLRAEYAARGWEALFTEAARFVGFEDADEAHYAVAAERLGMTLGAMRKAIFDLRTHHNDLLRTIVADTVADSAEVDGEITALLCACDLPGNSDERPASLPTVIRTFKPGELLARAMNTIKMTSGGTAKWTPPSDAEVARLFPQYEVRGIVGRGGMGAVYRAQQVTLDREVAIKLLPLEVSANPSFADRFVREARAMAKLSHPNIISVFDFGTTSEGHLYFVMEFVDGADLSQVIRGPGLGPNQALVIAGQVCTALAYAHGKGVIHRDIKPANVMVNTEGMAKVADFGLARLTGVSADVGHTVTGTIMGTPEYMAPEQKRGMAVDHRADIYSMGVMLYEMICKEPPQGSFEPPSQRAGCDAGIDKIVLKAMNRTPEYRYQSTVEMKADLDAAWQRQASGTPLPGLPRPQASPPRARGNSTQPLYTPPPAKSSAGLVSALMAAVAVIGGAIFFLNQKKPAAEKPVVPVVEAEKTAAPATPVPGLESPPPPTAVPEAAPVTPPALPVQPLTGPRDLLADVDVARDTVHGQWQAVAAGLRITSDARALLVFNYTPPEEYDFEIEFTIEGGSREVSQVMSQAGHSFLWKMGFSDEDPAAFTFGDIIDGQAPNAAGRKDALVRLPRLKVNQRYRSLVQVRRGSLGAFLDGNEVLRWSGDFQRLESDTNFRPPDPQKLGVGAWKSTILFHKAVVRPPGLAPVPEPARPKPAVPSNIAAAPAASAMVAELNDPRLLQLDTTFRTRFDNEAQKPYLAAIATLNQSFLTNWLARIRPAAQAKGNLTEVTAIDAEKEAIGRGEGVPAVDEPDTPDSLKNAHAAYRTAMGKNSAARIKTGSQLYDLYLTSLDAYVTELTRSNKIDQARKTKALRDEIATRKAELANSEAAEPAKAEATPGAPATEPKAGVSANASVREAAKWLLSKGGRFTISKGTLEGEVLTERDIPAGKFEVTGLVFDQNEGKLPLPTEAEVQMLRGMNGLRTVYFAIFALGDGAANFLTGNEELTTLTLHLNNLTDGVLSRLASARKLNAITLVHAHAFTGKGLDKMRWIGSLTQADFSDCGISDEGLQNILSAPKLHSLSLGYMAITNAGLVAIAGHRALDALNLDSCNGLTDADFAVLGKLKSLRSFSAQNTRFGDLAATAFTSHTAIRELNLTGTALTDAGLAKLSSLVRLQTLIVSGSGVTQAGVDAFKKSVPKCVVTQ